MNRYIAGTIAALAVSTIALAPAANADEAGYLDRLGNAGMVITDAGDAIALAYAVCTDLAAGWSPIAVADVIYRGPNTLTAYQSGYVVGAAMAEVC